MWTCKYLKDRAKVVLRGSYWKAFLVSIILGIAVGGGNISPTWNWHFGGNNTAVNPAPVSGGVDSEIIAAVIAVIATIVVIAVLASLAFRIFVGFPLLVGGTRYFVASAHGYTDLNNIGFGFGKGRYMDIVKALLWRMLFTFLWTLLFIIPGIIKSYSYFMVPYILADNPNIGYKRALELSMQMTDGEKADMFGLDLSFLGWVLLALFFTLGIGLFFLAPYINATKAELYVVLRQKALNNGYCTYEELNLRRPPQPEA